MLKRVTDLSDLVEAQTLYHTVSEDYGTWISSSENHISHANGTTILSD